VADIPPKSALELQIEAEAKELAEVPKIPIHHFMGHSARCHLCGRVVSELDLADFDTHIPLAPGMSYRKACSLCHPARATGTLNNGEPQPRASQTIAP